MQLSLTFPTLGLSDFFVRNRLTGENIPATIVRLPRLSHSSHGLLGFLA